jgi:hypothetical protein
MKHTLTRVCLVLFCIVFSTFSNAQVWQWATMHDYSGEGLAVTNDNFGNTFLSSYIVGNAVLGTTTITGTSPKSIASKYDANGNLVWASYIYGGYGYGIDCDNAGNVYVAGMFNGTLTAGTQTFVSAGSQDIYMIKYDNAGNFLWLKTAGSPTIEGCSAISVDSQGNPIIVGYTYPGTAMFGTLAVTSATPSFYAAKFDPSGNCIWVTNSTIGNSLGLGVSADLNGNVFVCGQHQGMNIGSSTLTTQGNVDFFLAKLNSNGSPIWATSGGGNSLDAGANVSVDPYGEVYLLGRCSSTNMVIGTQTLTNNTSSQDIFIAKYTASGANLWAQEYNYSGQQQPYGLAAYSGGAYFTAGLGVASYTIGPYTFTSTSVSDGLLLANVGSSGNLQYATALSGGGDDVMALHMDNMCNLTLGGDLQAANVQVGNTVFTHTASEALFVAKFNSGNTTPTLSILGTTTLCAGSTVTLTVSGASTYTWSTGVISNSIVVAPSTNTSYAVIGISPNYTCQAKLTQSIAVIQSSVNVNVSNTLICQGSSATLSVIGANTYTWSTTNQTQSIIVSPLITTTYSVTGTATANCSYQAARTISVLVSPSLNTSITQTTVCKGTKLTLTASGAATYTWSTGAQFNSVLYTAQSNTLFTVSATGTINGCATTKTIQITVSACIGIDEETSENSWSVFPNPSKGSFTFRTTNTSAKGEIIVYDLTGRIVKTIILEDNSSEHTVSLTEKGIYFANYKNPLGEIERKKLVVD